MVQIRDRALTLAEFLAQPETKPASEYIDGQIHPKPMPQGKHSALQGELTSILNTHLKPNAIARAFPELCCIIGDRAIVPDIAILTWDHIPRDPDGTIANTIPRAPDWLIEILSPGQPQTRPAKNILHCLNHGTTMGWLIDPTDPTGLTVFVYQRLRAASSPENCTTQYFDRPHDRLPLPDFAAPLHLTVNDLLNALT